MSHRHPSALKLYQASREACLRGPEPCHPEVLRGVRPASNSAFRIPHSAFSPSPRGLTLIEMLVALAVTLVMMAAVVNLFANISGSIRNRRAVIEVSSQLRQVRSRLAQDLQGATAEAQPAHGSKQNWTEPGHDTGYIEIIEGEASDAFPSELVDGQPIAATNLELDYATSLVPSGGDVTTNFSIPPASLTARAPLPGDVTNGRALGDWDDILALTVRSESEPFKAQVGGTTVESTLAEVIWYADENAQDDPATPANEATEGEPGMRRIYRRVLLIVPSLGPWNGSATNPPNAAENVSIRFVPADPGAGTLDRWVANTLGDLTKRENRAFREHDSTEDEFLFPHPFLRDRLTADPSYLVLSDALAFDVRVYEPGAPLYPASGNVVQPGDPGWFTAAGLAGAIPVGFGAYCDLGWNWDPAANDYYVALTTTEPIHFAVGRRAGWHQWFAPTTPPQPFASFPAVYDTWSFHYENNGLGEENLLRDFATRTSVTPLPAFAAWQNDTLDQGTNGLDDDGFNGVDDIGERETSPPYNTPLRGVKVSLRIYETDARQIRETSVTHSFAE